MDKLLQTQATDFFRQNAFEEALAYFTNTAEAYKDKDHERFVQAKLTAFEFQILIGKQKRTLRELQEFERQYLAITPDTTMMLERHFFDYVRACALFYDGEYSKTIGLCKKLIGKFPEPSQNAELRLILGRAQWRGGDLGQALHTLVLAIRDSMAAPVEREYILGKNLNLIAWLLSEMKQNKLAVRIFEISKDILQNAGLSEKHTYLGSLYADFAFCQLRLFVEEEKEELLRDALQKTEKAEDIAKRLFTHTNHRYWAAVCRNKSRIFKEALKDVERYAYLFDFTALREDTIEARKEAALYQTLAAMDEEKNAWKAAFGTDEHPTIARALNNKSRTLIQFQKIDASLEAAHQALLAAYSNFNDPLATSNPDIQHEPRSMPEAIKALHNKAEAFLLCFKQGGKMQCLAHAFECTQKAIELANKLRDTYQLEESKLILTDQIKPIFELVYEIGYQLQLYKTQNAASSSLISVEDDQIFLLLQQDRSALLFENMRQGPVPSDVELPVLKEYQGPVTLKRVIDDLIDCIRSKQPEMFQQVESGLNLILQERPYYSSSQQKPVSLDDFFEHMEDPPLGVISYFLGDQVLYAVLLYKLDRIQPTDASNGRHNAVQAARSPFSIYKLLDANRDRGSLPQLKKDIRAFHDLIDRKMKEQGVLSQKKHNSAWEHILADYIRLGRKLYQQLINPLDLTAANQACQSADHGGSKNNRKKEGIERIYILPDDELRLLPFEALLSKDIGPESLSYQKLPYMLHDYTISYHSSIPLLTQLYPNKDKQKRTCQTFTGILGYFLKDQDDHGKKLKKVLRYFSEIHGFALARIWKEIDANVLDFKYALEVVDIIQISAHGKFYDTERQHPYIYLAKNLKITPQDIRKFFRPVAHLVVLNCCVTGAGEMRRGEGMMDFSRALVELNVPNIVYTLINVPTASTHKVLMHFYDNLRSEGMTFGLALQQAKIKLAEREDTTPKDWAGVVFMGNQLNNLVNRNSF